MYELFKRLHALLNRLRSAPHLGLLAWSLRRAVIEQDLARWIEYGRLPGTRAESLALALLRYPEFRTLFYFRLRGEFPVLLPLVRWLYPPMDTLYIHTPSIGPGLFIQHGFCTIVSAERIGAHCWINQQVTIGYTNETDRPILEDNVTVYAGAKIIGKVTVGANSIVGANAVVVRSVPPNCTVAGVPACIVRRNGLRVERVPLP
jgi:serine O-acetyltransferase